LGSLLLSEGEGSGGKGGDGRGGEGKETGRGPLVLRILATPLEGANAAYSDYVKSEVPTCGPTCRYHIPHKFIYFSLDLAVVLENDVRSGTSFSVLINTFVSAVA